MMEDSETKVEAEEVLAAKTAVIMDKDMETIVAGTTVEMKIPTIPSSLAIYHCHPFRETLITYSKI
jgi:hypothetical protein